MADGCQSSPLRRAVTPPRADAALPKMELPLSERPGAEGRKTDDADRSRLKDSSGELKASRRSGRSSVGLRSHWDDLALLRRFGASRGAGCHRSRAVTGAWLSSPPEWGGRRHTRSLLSRVNDTRVFAPNYCLFAFFFPPSEIRKGFPWHLSPLTGRAQGR